MLPPNKISLRLAFTYIGLSILIFCGIPFLYVRAGEKRQQMSHNSAAYEIQYLAQTGPVKEALKTAHLEELLQLSSDNPHNLFAYSLTDGENLLMQSVLFEKVKLIREPENTLLVDYVARDPVAYLSDYLNLVIDNNGVVFPLLPYYTPKVLPKVYLGIQIEPFESGQLEDSKWDVAKEILRFFQSIKNKDLKLEKIDTSLIRAQSLGKREIIVVVHETFGEKQYQHFLRLNSDDYIQGIEHYLTLKKLSLSQDLVIDLRLLPDAYLTPIEEL